MLLSIVIPTRNRAFYCLNLVRELLAFSRQDFEIVVEDNSDDGLLSESLKKVSDPRLSYRWVTKETSSSHNMQNALDRSRGRFVCMVGDDDLILESIFDHVAVMISHDYDSLTPLSIPSYFWPDPNNPRGGEYTELRYKFGLRYESVDAYEKLEILFRKGIVRYQTYHLPRVYHGIVRRELIERMVELTGGLSEGLSPDIYSTVCFSILKPNHATVTSAFTIAGACPASTSAQSAAGGHFGVLEDAPHLRGRHYEWNPAVPRFYSVQTIWAESALRAAARMGDQRLLRTFQINFLWAELIGKHPSSKGPSEWVSLVRDLPYPVFWYRLLYKLIGVKAWPLRKLRRLIYWSRVHRRSCSKIQNFEDNNRG